MSYHKLDNGSKTMQADSKHSSTVYTEVADNKALHRQRQQKCPLVIKIGASWCGPCKDIEPAFRDLANRYKSVCKFIKLDADDSDHEQIYANWNIKTIPQFVIWDPSESHPRAPNNNLTKVKEYLASL